VARHASRKAGRKVKRNYSEETQTWETEPQEPLALETESQEIPTRPLAPEMEFQETSTRPLERHHDLTGMPFKTYSGTADDEGKMLHQAITSILAPTQNKDQHKFGRAWMSSGLTNKIHLRLQNEEHTTRDLRTNLERITSEQHVQRSRDNPTTLRMTSKTSTTHPMTYVQTATTYLRSTILHQRARISWKHQTTPQKTTKLWKSRRNSHQTLK
jgi:hypothetical protein